MIIKWPIRDFNSVYKVKFEIFEKNCPKSSFLTLWDFEYTREEPEHLSLHGGKFREYPGLVIVAVSDGKLWTVSETVLFCRMSMKV